MQVSVPMWAVLGVLMVGMLVADFLIFGRGRREVTVTEAAVWSAAWLAIALGFGGLLWAWQGGQASSEYLAGYLLERSLSLDNIFVFAVIFSYFAVPLAVQPRVLAWGIGWRSFCDSSSSSSARRCWTPSTSPSTCSARYCSTRRGSSSATTRLSSSPSATRR
jgi:Integral membrane protein TerC family